MPGGRSRKGDRGRPLGGRGPNGCCMGGAARWKGVASREVQRAGLQGLASGARDSRRRAGSQER